MYILLYMAIMEKIVIWNILLEEIRKYYINFDEENPMVLKVPHITASLADGAKASNTKILNLSYCIHQLS